ncbi:MAG: bifunctional UDP-N-acetylmuramoyl-tripeptide:D-alanyl-D-alanine ligase/alanine racemase [Flavobacteriales bacterium]
MAAHGHRLSAIAAAIGGTVHGPEGDPLITHLAIDSRKPYPADDTLFIALRGDRHDGHRYIASLIERGVRSFLVSALPDTAQQNQAHFILVTDTLDALQRLAGWHRAHFHAPVIGITGSNGKTVVKEWLFQLLRSTEHIVRSPGSWNSQVGVPLSVWEMGSEHTLGLFEAGISKPGEMERLRAVIRPTIGVFTNVGPAHGENFRDDVEKAAEKVKLFHDVKALVYCADHAAVSEAIHKSGLAQRTTLLGWSRERNGWMHLTHEEVIADRARITVQHNDAHFTFEIPFNDHASIENALHCVALLLHMGHAPEWIAERTPFLAPVSMRLEVVDGVHGMTLINDAYSNDVASLAIALERLEALAAGRPRTVVLSDILESGDAPALLYKRVADQLRHAGATTVLAVGPQATEHRTLFPGEVHAFKSTDDLIERFDPSSLKGAVVLVKGARTFALERVIDRWQHKVHGTVLEIDLEAIRHNLNHYRALLAKPAPALSNTEGVGRRSQSDQGHEGRRGVRIMAMVKAFGYGSGALELARLFAHERVDYLGVAYADEGIELRQQGIHLPILVMNPEPVPFETLDRFKLEAEVYDRRSLQEAIAFSRERPDAPPIHLKLDTGMHRLGFTESELPELLGLLRNAPHFHARPEHTLSGVEGRRVTSILSHLAASDAPEHDAFTREQLASFIRMADAITTTLGYKPLYHVANTGAIARLPEAHLDMVRLGIGLHGIGANELETALLRHTTTLRSPIAQIKTIASGETVGYNRSWIAKGDRTIATLPIGYADGLSRRLSNGVGRVWINGHAAPIVGTVCMDMCMVDVTGIACGVGDRAIVFDPAHPIGEVAQAMGTIPYEVLTSISQRVKRVYVHA